MVVVGMLALLVGPPELAAQGARWQFATGDGIEVVTSSTSKATQSVLDELLQYREAVGLVMPALAGLPRPDLRIIVVHQRRHLLEIVPDENFISRSTIGFHLNRPLYDTIMVDLSAGAENRNSAQLHSGATDNRVLVQHELVHHLVAHLARPAPRWLNEGLAEALSGAQARGPHYNFGRLHASHAIAVIDKGTMPWPLFWGAAPPFPTALQNSQFYGTAQLLVHAGIFGEDLNFRAAFARLLEEPVLQLLDEATVERATGMSGDALEKFLINYLRKGRYRFLRFDRDRLPPTPIFTFQPLSSPDRAAIFGALALNFDEMRGRALLSEFGPEQATARLAAAQVDLALSSRHPLDSDWLAALPRLVRDPDAPAYVHLAHALAQLRFGQYPLSDASLASIADAVFAYRAQRGLTKDARQTYVQAWALADMPPDEDAAEGLIALAERYAADPVMVLSVQNALSRSGWGDRVDHLVEKLPKHMLSRGRPPIPIELGLD